MSKITPCLWFGGDALQAAEFYASLLPGSRLDRVQRSLVDTPGGEAGSVLVVEFTLAGQPFMGLNGGHPAQHSHAISFSIDCADQAEVDRLWEALTADGGEPVQCGWLKDRWGMSWQIVPTVLPRMLRDPDTAKAERAMRAMLGMEKLDIAALQAAFNGTATA